MPLICEMCKAVRGEVYCIPVAGVGDIMICNRVVECVVQTYRMVADSSEETSVDHSAFSLGLC